MENYFKEIEPILNRLDDSIENIKQISKGKETLLNIGFVRRLGMSYIPPNHFFLFQMKCDLQCHRFSFHDLVYDLKKMI